MPCSAIPNINSTCFYTWRFTTMSCTTSWCPIEFLICLTISKRSGHFVLLSEKVTMSTEIITKNQVNNHDSEIELVASLLACDRVKWSTSISNWSRRRTFRLIRSACFLSRVRGRSVARPGYISKFIVASSHSTTRDENERLFWLVHQSCLNISGGHTEHSKWSMESSS